MIRKVWILFLFLFFLGAALVDAGSVQLPKTGQTTSYATGDDGDLERGVAWPVPRFTDHLNGTVTDNLTGLMWTKNANLPGVYKTWQEALSYVAGMNAGTYPNFGYTDWRLPNRKELQSLIDRTHYNPALPAGHPFTNVQGYYWSSTSYADHGSNAWIVSMDSGSVYANLKSFSNVYYVWSVRSGQVGPLVHSIIGRVTDNSVGLGDVTMTLSGAASDTMTTATDGTYSFTNLADGSYTVTPSMDGYIFSPASIDVTIAGADVTEVDFTAKDNTPPAGSILINGGKAYTASIAVTLALSCSDNSGGCSRMRLSNDKITWSTWEAYNTSKSWTLPSGDGTKRVYVRYKDKAGNISPIYSDGIKLDTTKPVLTGVSDTPDPFKPGLGEVSTISFTASDNLSGTCTIRAKIYNVSNTLVRTVTKSGVSCPSGGAAGSITWNGRDTGGTLVPVGTYTYKLQARDKALNWSAIRSGTTTVE